MKTILIIYAVCIIPAIVVYPVVKNLPPNVPGFIKFLMAWFIMPGFILWKIAQKLFKK